MQGIKLDEKLTKLSDSLGKQLAFENLYKTVAFFVYGIIVLASFFLSLANANFDFSKILQAQFWIDVFITLGGSIILKFFFGKYGFFEGQQHKDVQKALIDINEVNKEIKEKALNTNLKNHIDYQNNLKKVKALKEKIYKKLTKNEKSKYWQKAKVGILIYENLTRNNITNEERQKLEKELDSLNFSIDNYKVIYNKISEASIQTGLPIPKNDDEKMVFSEMHELFGKQIFATILTVMFTVLIAVTSIGLDGFSLTTIIVFILRFITFSLNAFLGFVIAKSSVEKVKLNVLQTICSFLKRFIELNKNEKRFIELNKNGGVVNDTNN